jgi:hypothetical protein
VETIVAPASMAKAMARAYFMVVSFVDEKTRVRG